MSLADIDAKCRAIQKQVSDLLYEGKPINSFEAVKKTSRTVLEDGQVFINDIRYGIEYPNSYLDIWYPDGEVTKQRPTIVYFHGGGFIFGDKQSGDPFSVKKDGSGDKLKEMVSRGYNLVNVNYALAPEYRFPVQVIQVNQVMEFLLEHAALYGLDMERVILTGGSAGADLTEIYGLAVTNPHYASRIGITPAITKKQLKVLAIDEAALDARTYDDGIHELISCWLGEETELYGETTQLINVSEHICGDYIPSFINTGNEGIYFIKEGEALERVLSEYNLEHELYYRDPSYEKLPHGYMDMLNTNKYAREVFEKMMEFIAKHV